jgi:hypothetical protein
MPPAPPAPATPAALTLQAVAERAAAHYAANRAAVLARQPELFDVLPPTLPASRWTWLMGRDGALTAKDLTETAANAWLGGCSLPRRAAVEMLSTMQVGGVTCALLAPTHAQQIRVALDRLVRSQAIIAIVPDAADLPLLLAAEPFAADVAAHRLFFAAGGKWADTFTALFDAHVGLPIPSHLVKTVATEPAVVDRLLPQVQTALGQVTVRQQAKLERILARPRPAPKDYARVCVVAPSGYTLWRDEPSVLLDLIDRADDLTIGVRLDTDDPAQAAPLALADAASKCDAVLTANLGRADLPGIVNADVPWVAWVTGPRVPACVADAKQDVLLLAGPSQAHAARAAGWPADRVHVAGWPNLVDPDDSEVAAPHLLILADLADAICPPQVDEFSSQRVLWDAIYAELSGNPAALADSAARYLTDRAKRIGIDPSTIDAPLFVAGVITPAFQHGVAQTLLAAGVPVKIAGRGWERVAAFANHTGGAVASRAQFAALINQAAGVAHVWPDGGTTHPVYAVERPVLHTLGRTAAELISDAKCILSGDVPATVARANLLSHHELARLVRG